MLAITGPSGCGKSTIAAAIGAALESQMDVRFVHGDSFFVGPKPSSYWTQENKDHPGAIDIVALRSAVVSAAAAPSPPAVSQRRRLVLLEGFLLLHDAPLMANVDAVLFLRANAATCLNRRLARSERTEHEASGLVQYYHNCVWPGFLKYTEAAYEALVRDGTKATAEVDASAKLEDVVQRALRALPAVLPAELQTCVAVAAPTSTSGPPRPPDATATAPSRPARAAGAARPASAITPLSEEERRRLFAKYGQLKAPTPAEMAEVSRAGCKMQ